MLYRGGRRIGPAPPDRAHFAPRDRPGFGILSVSLDESWAVEDRAHQKKGPRDPFGSSSSLFRECRGASLSLSQRGIL